MYCVFPLGLLHVCMCECLSVAIHTESKGDGEEGRRKKNKEGSVCVLCGVYINMSVYLRRNRD